MCPPSAPHLSVFIFEPVEFAQETGNDPCRAFLPAPIARLVGAPGQGDPILLLQMRIGREMVDAQNSKALHTVRKATHPSYRNHRQDQALHPHPQRASVALREPVLVQAACQDTKEVLGVWHEVFVISIESSGVDASSCDLTH